MRAGILWGATALFLLRVIAQLIQSVAPQQFLPSFEQFHGAVLPYPVLLLAQGLLLALMVFLNIRVAHGWRPGSSAGTWLGLFGAFYFLVMLFRFAAGLFDWIDLDWFHRPIPAFFHMVLAMYVLALAAHSRNSEKDDER